MKLKVKQLFFCLLILISKGFAEGIKTNQAHHNGSKGIHGKVSGQDIIKFTENKNQWDKNVLYRAQLDGGVLFLEKNCFTYNFYDK
jgi:hypothetical protein